MKTIIGVLLLALPCLAQWVNFRTPGAPRNKDGTVNLTAPAPRAADGKPDLSGMWQPPTGRQLTNLADGVSVSMLPWAEELYRKRQESFGKDSPSSHCLPHSVTDFDALFT